MKNVDEIKSSLVDAVDLHIKDRGMTQQRVAEILGVTQGRVSNLVNGRMDLFSLDNLVNICGRLGMNVSIHIKDAPKPGRRYTGKPIKVKQPVDYEREE